MACGNGLPHWACAMNDTARLRLSTVLGGAGATRAIVEGRIQPRSATLDIVAVPRLIDGFRRMVRAQEFAVCEMAITTYITARAHGKRLTALPVFPVRGFHHGAILINSRAGIRTPKDLEGRRIGVNRGYTVTTGVWVRGILEEESGVDPSKVTWVLSGDEHVAEFVPPANVVPASPTDTIAEMLIAGELAAAVGVEIDHPDIVPLYPDGIDRGMARLAADGHHPINHLIVMRDDIVDGRPDLAGDLFEVFRQAKRHYLDGLRGNPLDLADRVNVRVMAIVNDPLPYGIGPNRAVLDMLMRHLVSQRIVERPIAIDELFAAGTLDLAG